VGGLVSRLRPMDPEKVKADRLVTGVRVVVGVGLGVSLAENRKPIKAATIDASATTIVAIVVFRVLVELGILVRLPF